MKQLRKRNRTAGHQLFRPLCASSTLHLLLVLLLSIPPNFDAVSDGNTRLDLFWFVSAPPPPAAGTALPPASKQQAGDDLQESGAVPQPRDDLDPLPAPVQVQVETAAQKAIVVATVMPALFKKPSPAAAHVPVTEKWKGAAAAGPVVRQTVQAIVSEGHSAAALVALDRPAIEQATSPLPKRVQPAPVQEEVVAVDKKGELPFPEKPAAKRLTDQANPPSAAALPAVAMPAAAGTRAEMVQPKPAVAQPKPTVNRAVADPGKAPAAKVGAAAEQSPRQSVSPATATRPTGAPAVSAKVREASAVPIPSLHGDLKMIITGDSDVKLSVVFREYPKTRRKKAQSRAEAHRRQRVTPVVAKTGKERKEAVIETAQEGIYTFSAEAENGEPVAASFTLKVFENGPHPKVAVIGARTVAGKTVVTRVLMPEGILWDDDAAFTGIVEDAESTTKFNARTGLAWKEYND